MTHRIWGHSAQHWHLPHWRAPAPFPLPRSRPTPRQVAALRRGLIVALCALLAGGLTYHLQGSTRGPYAPTSTAGASRA